MRALVLVGPTAVGKTALSFEIAELGFEIVSADSVQVYRYFDIGSGKPSIDERGRITHHCIDIVEPDYPFTAGDFCREAEEACNEIVTRGKMPFFVGGTGLYIDSFFEGLSLIPKIDSSVQRDLLVEVERFGIKYLYDLLVRVDSKFAESIHPNDRQRILRGLEVYRGTGEPLSSFFGAKKGFGSDATVYVGLVQEMDTLRKMIDERVDRMIGAGFIDEVIAIRSMGYSADLKSMKSIGYCEINGFIDSRRGLAETIQTIKTNTKKYAKRQMTWFKKNKRIRWFYPSQRREILEYVRKV